MSDTPRTDAYLQSDGQWAFSSRGAEFMRKLERELAAAVDAAESLSLIKQDLQRELAEARHVTELVTIDRDNVRGSLQYTFQRILEIAPTTDDNRPIEAQARRAVERYRAQVEYAELLTRAMRQIAEYSDHTGAERAFRQVKEIAAAAPEPPPVGPEGEGFKVNRFGDRYPVNWSGDPLPFSPEEIAKIKAAGVDEGSMTDRFLRTIAARDYFQRPAEGGSR